mgnify:CR=1 FL=1
MSLTKEEKLIELLTDYVVLLDGDWIIGVEPDAEKFTRKNILQELKAGFELLQSEDETLKDWYKENISLLEMIDDELFQKCLQEKILLTEAQVGQMIWSPISDKGVEYLAEKLSKGNEQQIPRKNKKVPPMEIEKQKNFFARFFKK